MICALLHTNRKLKLPENRWLTFRLGSLAGISSAIFVVFYFLGPSFQINPVLVQVYSWVSISAVDLIGLYIIRMTYVKQPSQSPQGTKNWLDQLRHPGQQRGDPDPPAAPVVHCAADPPSLEQVLTEKTLDALTNNNMNLTLEIPENTELNILGQKWKVTQGKLTVRTKKKPIQDVEKLFDPNRRRRLS